MIEGCFRTLRYLYCVIPGRGHLISGLPEIGNY